MSRTIGNLQKLYFHKNLSLAWPLAINALLTQSMMIIDTLLVSPLGEIPLAAMGIAGTIITFFLGLQIALANGTQLIIGRAFGCEDDKALACSFYHGLLINICASLMFVCIITFCGEKIALGLTEDNKLAEQVTTYLYIAQFILLINAVTQTIASLLYGQGKTKPPLYSYMIELPFNTIISYVLIFGGEWHLPFVGVFSLPGLGLMGAAYGSLAAIILRLCYLSLYVGGKSVLSRSESVFSRKEFLSHFNEISPIAVNHFVLAVGSTVYLLLFSQLDIYSYVAITLVFPWIKIATQFIVAWAQANAISITQAIGKKQQSHIPVIISICIKFGMLMAVFVSLALYGFSHSVATIYPNIEPQTYVALALIMPLYVALPLVRSFNTIAGNSLRAMGQSVAVLKIHFISQWLIILPLCAAFIFYFNLSLFWAFALMPIEEIIKAFPFMRMLKNSNSK